MTANVSKKLLTLLVMSVFFFSSLALAQQPPPQGGAGGANRGEQQPGAGPTPFGQPGQIGSGNNLAPPSLDPAAPAISRQQALNLVQDSFQGRVLSVRMDSGNWQVRVDQDGTVFNIFVDGRTGEVNRSPE